MLWVFAGVDILETARIAEEYLPTGYLDLSKVVTADLPNAIRDYCDHHSGGHIYAGYLDPLLMLTPMEETRMRRGFTQCDMYIVVSNPLILPTSWKNGTKYIQVIESHSHVGRSETLHHGGTAHVSNEVEHR